MEVHAHSHSPRKKWTHYFWEFLMLFLAVFCGFLAEYQLEHKIEKDREKQFIQSLLEDLAEDTVSLSEVIGSFESNIKRADTLMKLLCSPDVRNHGGDLYYLGRRTPRSDVITLNDRTIQQMKNSGGFRLIRKQKVSNAVIEYYNHLNHINMLSNTEFNIRDKFRDEAIHIFYPLLFDNIITSDNNILRPEGNPALRTYDQEKLLMLAGIAGYMKSARLGITRSCSRMRLDAIRLIVLIKKEYHLE